MLLAVYHILLVGAVSVLARLLFSLCLKSAFVFALIHLPPLRHSHIYASNRAYTQKVKCVRRYNMHMHGVRTKSTCRHSLVVSVFFCCYVFATKQQQQQRRCIYDQLYFLVSFFFRDCWFFLFHLVCLRHTKTTAMTTMTRTTRTTKRSMARFT